MTLTLHPIPGDDRFYCGPTAIAAFTGEHPKGKVREAINRHRYRPATQGVCRMFNTEMVAVLRAFGLRCVEPIRHPHGLTLQEFVRRHPNFCGVVNVTGHYVAVSRGMALDNHSLIARPIAVFKGRRKLVRYSIQVYAATSGYQG
jgi:hypothetical protein